MANLYLVKTKYEKNTLPDGYKRNAYERRNTMGYNEIKPQKPWEKSVKLPRNIWPIHYNLYINPDLENGSLYGEVSIKLQVRQPTKYILCHSKDLNITQTKLHLHRDKRYRYGLGKAIRISSTFEYVQNQFFVVETKNILSSGIYILTMKFKGQLQTTLLTGFYLRSYKKPSGEMMKYASTQFQPTDARTAFPCFDEPYFRSTFKIKLVRPSKIYRALSNMDEIRSTPNKPEMGKTTVEFAVSPKMVSYLVCFIISDFEYKETKQHGTKLRVFATPDKIKDTTYAMDIGAYVLDYYSKYFGIEYVLPKLDLAAVPDFDSLAMENWGLSTFRETHLLFDSKGTALKSKENIAETICHEIVHQWFGNLVSIKWWDDLWLNEGFTTFMAYKGIAVYHKNWDEESLFIDKYMNKALLADATVNSHPIIQPVSHPDQINEIFDDITYNKGATILRMLEFTLGKNTFKKGVHQFLEQYKYDTAESHDLWSILDDVSNMSMSSLMKTWTNQMGFPMLQLEKISDKSYKITQKRYLHDDKPTIDKDSPYGYKWDVPVTWITHDNSKPEVKIFGHQDADLEISLDSQPKWIKFNVGQKGFYRVNYPPEDWQKFGDLLANNKSELNQVDRASLLNDAFSFAESGHLSYKFPLGLTKYMVNETDPLPWQTIFKYLRKMLDISELAKKGRNIAKFVLRLVKPHYKRITWNFNCRESDIKKRDLIFRLACKAGLPDCNRKASELLDEVLKNNSYKLPVDLQGAIFNFGVKNMKSREKWNKLFKLYMNERSAQMKNQMLSSLGQIKNPKILREFLKFGENETIVKSQDYDRLINSIARNPVGLDIVWDYLQNEWPSIVQKFGDNGQITATLRQFPEKVSKYFTTDRQLRQLKTFLKKNLNDREGFSEKKAVEQATSNIKWIANYIGVINNIIANMKYNN